LTALEATLSRLALIIHWHASPPTKDRASSTPDTVSWCRVVVTGHRLHCRSLKPLHTSEVFGIPYPASQMHPPWALSTDPRAHVQSCEDPLPSGVVFPAVHNLHTATSSPATASE